MRKLDLIGQRFGKLVVLEEIQQHFTPSGRSIRLFNCQCDCGNVSVARTQWLTDGRVVSCGCHGKSLGGKRTKTHGMSLSGEFYSYQNMIARCSNPALPSFKNYGERGIFVAHEWIGDGGFERFLEHVGKRPSDKHTIDRIDTNRGYEPGNVRWATRIEQAMNKRNSIYVTFQGQRHFLMDLCEKFCVRYQTAYRMMRRGISADEIFGPHNLHVRHPGRGRQALL